MQLLCPFYTRGSKLKEMAFLIEIIGKMRLPKDFDSKFCAFYSVTLLNDVILLSTFYEPDTSYFYSLHQHCT